MFTVSKNPLEDINFKKAFANPKAGALATFEGVVRDENEERKVLTLEYEIFDELAVKEGNAILSEAKKKFQIIEAQCYHRAGKLNIGEMAVWVGVTAVHRSEAFDACKFIIDEIKARLPIWKKEYYSNGDSGWVNCKVMPKAEVLKATEEEFYARQMVLPQVGADGQAKLKAAKVLVVGAGGLGCPALLYLASAGVGTIGISEFDTLEIHNLHRQILYDTADVGKPKAELAAKRIKSLNPFISVRTHGERLNAQNVVSLIKDYDIILDCTDNFETKFLLSDAAHFHKKAFICASVYQFEGQMKFYKPSEKNASCLRCLWPEIPEPGCIGNCATAGILGVIPGVLGTLQAAEVVKYILGLPTLSSDEMLILDLLTYRSKKLKQSKDENCPLCGKHPKIKALDEKNYGAFENISININKLSPQELNGFQIVDVREPDESRKKPLQMKCSLLPSSRIGKIDLPFDKATRYLLVCAQGVRSAQMAQTLRNQGFENIFSASDGVDAINRLLKTHGHKEHNN